MAIAAAAENDEPEELGSSLPRRELGRLLREARDAAGLTLQQAADLMEWGKTTLQNHETAKTAKIREREIRELCELYGVDDPDRIEGMLQLARETAGQSWWRSFDDVMKAKFDTYIGLEAGASVLDIFQPLVLPGLLQTPEYTKALDRLAFPKDSKDALDRRAALRMHRQHLITRTRKPARISVILTQAVLQGMVGGPGVMGPALRHVADLSTRDNVEMRVLPSRSGLPTGYAVSQFIIMGFPKVRGRRQTEPAMVYAESFAGDVYLQGREDVARFRSVFRSLQSAALDVRRSRDMIREIAREYDSER
ncbi:helix-turn-helix domain-containing protein [Nocardia sp. CA2R105]|uniref:helix-turn-helix domain-containing protein n=1 Tax=Nocardia coffeae TaxID=2873381 RepID=UPI001CA7478B|nr:helix-turn-helix transcriptional regulator [Nocardia coffeae]MBY8858636.1 helix-turn-helix domain-containing protein [Nocardia coffeae]